MQLMQLSALNVKSHSFGICRNLLLTPRTIDYTVRVTFLYQLVPIYRNMVPAISYLAKWRVLYYETILDFFR